MKTTRLWTAMTVLMLGGASAWGSGMLIPKDESLPPLAIKHQRIQIRIKDGTATASIEQVFKNSVNRDLEAVYVFPLPENASIADFAMYMNGKRVSGQLVEKQEARRIYEDIVRRMRDPGLLEHLGGNLFKVSVYPVPRNGEQKIEISYSHALEFEAGLYKYVYPLKTGEQTSRTLEDFTLKVDLQSAIPIKSIYSPSHKLGISRKGDHEAVIGFEEDKAALDRDVVLYYGVSKKDFGINLLTRREKDQDGYFMLLLAPTVEVKEDQVQKRDVSFVVDTSGSMSGEKIQQVRQALKYCVSKLNPGDRFNVVRFSTEVEPLDKDFLECSDKNRKRAVEFIESFQARGGTAIAEALAFALDSQAKGDRPHLVIFLTDGKPTIGETDPAAILDALKKKSASRARIFVFGVGDDLNAFLLDRLSSDFGGVSQYVKPGEDIEVQVSAFADKIYLPVLAQPKLGIDRLDVRMMHPQTLPDLFSGSQLTVFGRYSGSGDFAIRLSGEVNGKKVEHVFEGTFPKVSSENEFLPRLWATRRVGYLLDQIRLHGEDKELKEEVIRLGKEHGILTPYTSYLVLEDSKSYPPDSLTGTTSRPTKPRPGDDRVRELGAGWRRDGAPAEKGETAGRVAAATPAPAAIPMFDRADGPGRLRKQVQAGGGSGFEFNSEEAKSLVGEKEGHDSIALSQAIGRYKDAEASESRPTTAVRYVGAKIFYLVNGVWMDRDYRDDMKAIRVKYADTEYFKLLQEKPDLRRYLALGEKVIVCLDDKTAVIVE